MAVKRIVGPEPSFEELCLVEAGQVPVRRQGGIHPAPVEDDTACCDGPASVAIGEFVQVTAADPGLCLTTVLVTHDNRDVVALDVSLIAVQIDEDVGDEVPQARDRSG